MVGVCFLDHPVQFDVWFNS